MRTERAWEDWLAILMGLVIVLAPWIVDETTNRSVVINAALAGSAVLMLAELDLVQVRRWPEACLLACGIWVLLSPIVFGYGGMGSLRIWHVISGLTVAGLGAHELWHSSPSSR